MKGPSRAIRRFLWLLAGSAALLGTGYAWALLPGDAGVAMHFLHLYLALPLGAGALALWAGKGGVHPFAAFLPIGLFTLMMESPGIGLLCMLIGLVCAVAGQEWQKRSQEKGRKHGRK